MQQGGVWLSSVCPSCAILRHAARETYLGGARYEVGRHIGIDPGGTLVAVTGETDSRDMNCHNAPEPEFTAKVSSFLAVFDVADITGQTERP